MAFRIKYMEFIIGVFCVALILTACGQNGSAHKGNGQTEQDITVTDAMGKVTIPNNPRRVLAPNMEDSLVALGVTPAAQWSIGTTVHDYLQPYLKGVPKIEWDLPLEQTIKANPDLIIFSSAASIKKGQYEKYKKIAPTYVFKDAESADWRKQLQVMGQLLGKEEKAKEALADYDAKVKKARADIKAAIGDESAAILWVFGKQYYLFENTRYAANVLYHDLGVAQPDMVKKLPKAETNWSPVSLEALADLDADHIFLVSRPNEAGLEQLKQSSVWKSILAVKKGNVYEMEDPSHWTINGLVASKLTMDKIMESLTK
ncbi:iron-hydroxamate ABC transporter substrate-binding protein [Thermoflavimicrobium dichotomicum]|uniref:Iron complex transport system substrate-binding protein n=1 Tax=Thermoflavimicrobium dichotomicum TaxID=46223 RepID=A0A1I3KBL5_9BACL|nr:iron-hydroxamate ABC transporter substrate-binding protein [Thermoflavimicrobium dichotomicum]SFI69911.1 iron complex transport system substrate-binding protein [Thermoflavimicrobium dichotomicum]